MSSRVVVSRATRSATQDFEGGALRDLLAGCHTLTYDAIRCAEENAIANRRGRKGQLVKR